VARLAAESGSQRIREQTLADQAAVARNQNEEMRGELERLRGELQAGAQSAPRTRPRIFALLLSPQLVRGGSGPQSVAIPRAADAVRLLMRVDRADSRSFQVIVRNVGGREILKRSALKPRLENDGYTVAVEIPSGRLAPGDYILTLSAGRIDGETEEVNNYFLRITKL
jgi:hypothetical protein